MVRYDIVWYDLVWYGMVRYGKVCHLMRIIPQPFLNKYSVCVMTNQQSLGLGRWYTRVMLKRCDGKVVDLLTSDIEDDSALCTLLCAV